MDEAILVREWGADEFHRHVLELEKRGYTTRLETYTIIPEVHPDPGPPWRTIAALPSGRPHSST